MARLTLALLGGFRATAGSGTGLSITSKKARALLAYLALRPGQQHSRDHVAGLLWGDVDEAQARQSLRQTLLSLRSLPRSRPPILLTESDDIAVAAVVEVDVPRFERLASRAQPAALVQALALYRGDLLSGFHLKEPRFQTWLQGERERLRGRAIDVLERLSTRQVGRRAIDAALQTGLRLLAMDSLQESVHRALMRLYLQSGRTAAALNQYRICADALQRELGVEPDPATKTLYRQISARETRSAPAAIRRTQDAAAIHVASDVTPLVGRWALGYLWAARGRADEAIGPLERSLALADEWHLEIMWPIARAWLGSVYAASGRLSDGLTLLQQSVEAYRLTDTLSSFSLVHLGRGYLLANRFEDALSSAMRASTVAREQHERGHEAWAHHLLGAIASRVDSVEKAEDHYHRAMGVAKELGMPPLLGHCHLGLGMLFSRAGQLRDSEQNLATAAAMFGEMGMQSALVAGLYASHSHGG